MRITSLPFTPERVYRALHCALPAVAPVPAVPPLAVRLFLAGQVAVGNGEVPVIVFMQRHETTIVRGMWVFMAAGAAIALPHILRHLGWKV